MPEFCFSIAGADYIATYSAKVTYEGAPECGPSYASGGQPADPPEFEVTVEALFADPRDRIPDAPLELPAWLREAIEQAIIDDDDAGAAIMSDHSERQEADRCDAAEARAEFMREEAAERRAYHPLLDD